MPRLIRPLDFPSLLALPCLLVLCSVASATGLFPLQVAPDHRHLAQADGTPFFVVGDAGWSLIAQLDDENVRRYLDDRAHRGFNAIIVNLIEHKFATHAPAALDGTPPFLAAGDLARPNPKYFDRAHDVIAEAQRRGLCIFLCAAYLGWNGGDEGFFREIKAAGPAALRSYGRYLGHRFRDLPNIVWMMGGDYALPPSERWTASELAAGLREGGAGQIMTAHGGQTSAVETFGDQSWLAVDTAYSYRNDLYVPLLASYDRQPVRPYVLIETLYEGEHATSADQLRRQAWWALLSGAAGQFFGNNPIWHFDGPGLFPASSTWRDALNSVGSRDIARLGRFISSRPWEKLVPVRDSNLIAAGRGDGAERISAARTPDGRLFILYVPSAPNRIREFTLDLSAAAGPVSMTWFDPGADVKPVSTDAARPNTRGQKFLTPGNNGAGANDWVLVLEVLGPG